MCEPVGHCIASQTLGIGRTLPPSFPFLHWFLNGWCLCLGTVTSDPCLQDTRSSRGMERGLVLKLNCPELKVVIRLSSYFLWKLRIHCHMPVHLLLCLAVLRCMGWGLEPWLGPGVGLASSQLSVCSVPGAAPGAGACGAYGGLTLTRGSIGAGDWQSPGGITELGSDAAEPGSASFP